MGDITFGQYYPANSILHRLDPRVKFVGTLAYIISLFLVKGVIGYLFITLVLAAALIISKVPAKMLFGTLKVLWAILIITALFNLFLTPGDKILWQAGFLKITDQGIRMAVRLAVRLIYLVLGSSLMTLTTTPTQLTDGMEYLFRPLTKVGVPVPEIAMIVSIALRFIPILSEETEKIRRAQMARGADFESGNIFKRLKAMIPLLVPLFVSAFRRANDLAMAMEARCYRGGDTRTQMKPLVYHKRDRGAYAVILAVLLISLTFRIWGSRLIGGTLI